MNIPYDVLPLAWYWAAAAVHGVVLLLAARAAAWRHLLVPEQMHAFLGVAVLLLLLWELSAELLPGFHYHFLGASVLALMGGWGLAVIGITVILAAQTLAGGGQWYSLPLNALIMAAIPVSVTLLALSWTRRHLPRNPFVFILINAFFVAAVAMLATLSAAVAMLVVGGAYPWAALRLGLVPLLPLLVFPEAFISGVLVAGMVGLRPNWLATYEE